MQWERITYIQAVSAQSLRRSPLAVRCITWIKTVSTHRVFDEDYMQWECITWNKVVSPERVFVKTTCMHYLD